MKKILPILLSFIAFSFPSLLKAQSFSMADTVIATVDSGANIDDLITNNLSSGITLKWHITATTFPADWLTEGAFGICDNQICYYNAPSTDLWNSSTNSGATFTSGVYAAGTTTGAYHVVLALKSATSYGTHTLTVNLTDPANLSSKTVTFIITKPAPSAVPSVTNAENNVNIYPNPATSELNVVYDAGADVKTIAVYNIIGKVMTVYKVTDNNSANLNIDNIPSGIYFVRLMNSHGGVVVTRKFTKQ